MTFNLSTHLLGDPQFQGRAGRALAFWLKGGFTAEGLTISVIENDWGPGPADQPYRVQILMTSNQIRNVTAYLTLLANAGPGLPNQDRPAVIAVKRTVPLKLDGKLDDWTNDMEDRNVSRFRHAEPIAITSRDAISGKIADDLEQSAVVYLLCDDAQIFFGGIAFARDANLQVDLQLDDHRITLDLGAETVAVDGHPAAGVRIAGGRQTAGSVADTRLLSLLAVDRRVGNLETKTSVTGHTFEAAIPWAALGRSTLPSAARGSLRLIRREGAVLQVPEVEESGAATTLLLRFEAR